MKGLKLYENAFTDSELSKLIDFSNELRAAGQNGELPGNLVPQLSKIVVVVITFLLLNHCY